MRHIKTYITTLALVITIGITGAGQAADTSPATTQPSKTEQRQLKVVRKQIVDVQKTVWTCQAAIGEKKYRSQYDTWLYPKSVKFRQWIVDRWTSRLGGCKKRKAAYIETKRQWNWQAFPQWIIDLARCETSINWHAEGSSSHGVFYSAFNIGRSRYDGAAHKMGVRGWNEGAGVPSPYEQAMTVIGYVRIYGDGFAGNCAGIARSSW